MPARSAGLPHVAPAMVRLFLLDRYDDAELLSEEEFGAGAFGGYDEDRSGFLEEEEQAAFQEDDGIGFWGDES